MSSILISVAQQNLKSILDHETQGRLKLLKNVTNYEGVMFKWGKQALWQKQNLW